MTEMYLTEPETWSLKLRCWARGLDCGVVVEQFALACTDPRHNAPSRKGGAVSAV